MNQIQNSSPPFNRLWAAAIPYATVLVGLYWIGNAWLAFVPYHAAIFLVLALYGELGQFGRLRQGFDLVAALVSISPCLIAGVMIYLFFPVASHEGLELDSKLSEFGLSGTLWFVMIAYSFLVNPWFEEAFWRGFLGSDKSHPVIADLLFAGYHVLVLVLFIEWQWVVLAGALLIGGAWFWRYLTKRFRGLAVAAVTHLAADIGIMAAIHLLMF